MKRIPVVAVIGPTASGKSDLAVEICRHFGGEVVSADSMQIYKGMDIATAKPTEKEKKNVPHHMMDFLDNTEDYSVALYQRAAAECIADIHSRGLLPVVCGGTGLYVDTLLNNVKLSEESYDGELRRSLLKRAEDEGAEKLLESLYGKYSLYICSNGSKKVQDSRIASSGIARYFDGIFISEELGLNKPDKRYLFCADTGFQEGEQHNGRGQPYLRYQGRAQRGDQERVVQSSAQGDDRRCRARL